MSLQLANLTSVTTVDGATNSEPLWKNIRSVAIITCRVSAWIQLSRLALTQVNSFAKTKTRKMKLDRCITEI